MFFTIIIFFIILGVLILSHEFGHFIFAKLSGIKVEEFGFGFPPRIGGFKRGETLYSLNLLPFGGFVKILGEDEVESDNPRSFASRRLYSRAIILAAGVVFNLIVAWFILSLGFFIGAPTSISDSDNLSNSKPEVRIVEVQSNTPAFFSGLRTGDILENIKAGGDFLAVSTIQGVRDFIDKHRGVPVEITYRRGSAEYVVSATPSPNPSPGNGALGIGMGRFVNIRQPWYQSVWSGLVSVQKITWLTIQGFFDFLKSIFFGGGGFSEVAGPVGIVAIVGETSRFGFLYLLQLTALLSINIGVINFIPFPGLDGGRLLLLFVEYLKGKPLSERGVQLAHSVGFFVLVSLMFVVTYFDILRRIHGAR